MYVKSTINANKNSLKKPVSVDIKLIRKNLPFLLEKQVRFVLKLMLEVLLISRGKIEK